MTTLKTNLKYSWLNKLSERDRLEIVDYYLQGYAPYTLMKVYGVSQCTIEHHLKAANIYMKGRRATKKIPIIRTSPIVMRAITFPPRIRLVTKLDTDKYYFDEYGDKYQNYNKTYSEYLKEEKSRPHIVRDNERLENKGAGNNFTPMIHISLVPPIKSVLSFQYVSL